ncbi:MAG: hypothetical protein AAF768_10760 [Pseudomonadota bacterium]
MAAPQTPDFEKFVQDALERASELEVLSERDVKSGVAQNLELLRAHYETVLTALSDGARS